MAAKKIFGRAKRTGRCGRQCSNRLKSSVIRTKKVSRREKDYPERDKTKANVWDVI